MRQEYSLMVTTPNKHNNATGRNEDNVARPPPTEDAQVYSYACSLGGAYCVFLRGPSAALLVATSSEWYYYHSIFISLSVSYVGLNGTLMHSTRTVSQTHLYVVRVVTIWKHILFVPVGKLYSIIAT